MKLLFVVPEYPPEFGGGIGTYYGALLPALVRRGHRVDVVVGSAFVRDGAPREHEGVRVDYLQGSGADRLRTEFSRYAPFPEVQGSLAAAHAMWEQVDGGEGYDLVEVTDWGLLSAPWLVRDGPPVLVQLHGSNGQIARHAPRPERVVEGIFTQLLETSLFPFATALSTIATDPGEEWEQMLRRRVHVVPPPLRIPGQIAAPGGSDRAFVAGRLQHWKGPHVLCEALATLGSGAPVVEWAGRVVADPASGRPTDEVLADEYPSVWGTSLRPVGLLPPDEIARRQASASVVVVPSLWDVFNLTAVEAMAQGAILVCSDGAGAVDLVVDGESGFVVPAGDADALATALRRATTLTAPERAEMGATARRVVEDRLDPDRVAAEKSALYETVIATDEKRPAPRWLRDVVAPSADGDAYRFLDQLPLRDLGRYVADRAVGTIGARVRR